MSASATKDGNNRNMVWWFRAPLKNIWIRRCFAWAVIDSGMIAWIASRTLKRRVHKEVALPSIPTPGSLAPLFSKTESTRIYHNMPSTIETCKHCKKNVSSSQGKCPSCQGKPFITCAHPNCGLTLDKTAHNPVGQKWNNFASVSLFLISITHFQPRRLSLLT